ncbi:MAG: tetratricopeptide repeat protein [Elusimicrobiota bacterium]|nr:tetratricopeptide repeat protein [Elusimicrobiota bacterium]
MKLFRGSKKLLAAGGLLGASLFLRGAAGAGEELKRAHEAAALGSEARAFDIAMDGLKTLPPDRELFLYAVELLPESSPGRARVLATVAGAMLEKKSEDYAWHLGICKAMRVSERAAEALSNCKKALEQDPTVYPVYRELGLTYAAAGNPRKAAETLAQGVEISSSSYQAHYYLAKLLEKRGDSSRASASYSSGLALAKRDASLDAGYYRALLKAGLKRTELKKEKARPKIPKPASPGNKQLAASCLGKFREEFLKDNLGMALATSDGCLKFAPSDPQLAAERAPLMVRLGKYEGGVKEYERAASLYGEKNPASALYRVKAAETWIKLGKPESALAQYRLALKAGPRDMNALKGLAAALEARSDLSGAIETYEAILKLEPGNERARARIDELKSGTLTSAQILEELVLRRAADKKKAVLQPADIKLFKAIKAAETGGAVDYLKRKVPSARGLTAERKTGDGVKLLLTGDGYKVYIFHATREAVKFFEAEGVGLREVFKLRTLAGAPIFDPGGKLTPEGEDLWRRLSPGDKTWLLTYEPVPASPQAQQANKDIAEAEKSGYREISEPEYLWLLRATDCPEDVLQKDPVNLKLISDGARVRYMLCYVQNSFCMNPANILLPSYIEAYRAGNDAISDAKTSTAFFGSGGVKKHRYCEDGKIWGVDTEAPGPVRASTGR